MMEGKIACNVKAQSPAESAMSMLTSVTNRIGQLSDRITSQLGTIMVSERPMSMEKALNEPEEEFPQYFNEIRDLVSQCNRNISHIESCLNRCGVK